MKSALLLLALASVAIAILPGPGGYLPEIRCIKAPCPGSGQPVGDCPLGEERMPCRLPPCPCKPLKPSKPSGGCETVHCLIPPCPCKDNYNLELWAALFKKNKKAKKTN